MTRRVTKALEDAAKRLGKSIGEDAGKAVGGLYRQAGQGTKQVAANVAKAEAEHVKSLSSIKTHGPGDGLTPKSASKKRKATGDGQTGPAKRPKKPGKYPLPPRDPKKPHEKRDPKQTAEKVDPKTHDLAQAVNQRRRDKKDRSKVNYAAVEYRDEHGNTQVEVGHSKGRHSERVVGVPLLERQDKLDEARRKATAEGQDPGPERRIKVLRMYSERDYCNQPIPDCNSWTQHYFPDAKRSYAFEYDHYTEGSKKRGNMALEDHLRWVHGDPPIKRRK
ncbi:nucleic acid/nucleotide deaminase domain-containing protein [Kitasatospora sp. NPDC056138]|uniref:nucleic acid/nucleotide deaminase domain-containing protein n=1 Tax=Kitasatospora sp. NPDC056138 TaxID=3345724 RepID=UPI0035DE12AF